MGPYKTAIGVLVKDNIKCRYWHKKDSEWVVPSSLMELCWQKLKDLFEIPPGFNEEVTKDRAFFIMGNSFKYFRYYLNKNYVKNGIEPEWHKYPHQQEYWSDFMSWKVLDEGKELSEANTINSHKNRMPHCTGSRGYARKIQDWEREEEQLTRAVLWPIELTGILAL
jgi:hypothetical protein